MRTAQSWHGRLARGGDVAFSSISSSRRFGSPARAGRPCHEERMSYLTDTFSLGDRRAVVTGASRGIGRAIALALAAAGAEVVVHYHSSADAAGAVVDEIHAKGGTAHAARRDLSDASGVDSLFADVARRWGGELDILVNNAGDM